MAGVLAAVGAVGMLPVAVAQAAAPRAAAPAILPAPAPKPCPGCETYVINVPNEPTDSDFGSVPNTSVDVRVEFPDNWSQLTCGDQFGVVARDGTSGDGLAVTRWSCRVRGQVIRFSGPAPRDAADAPIRFLLRAEAPPVTDPANPANALFEEFIDLTQTYVDGEQQRRRIAKLIELRRALPSAGVTRVSLPPYWIAPDCLAAHDASRYPVTGWNCTLKIGEAADPPFEVRWVNAGGANAQHFYFHAFTKREAPFTSPILRTPGNLEMRDVMFSDGQMPAVLFGHLRPGFRKPKPTLSPEPTVTVRARGERRPKDCTPYRISETNGATIAPQNPNTSTTDANGNVVNNFFGNQGGPFNNGGSINVQNNQWAVDPGCVPPNLIVDPCAGAFFGKYGHGRFGPRREDVPSACYGPFGDRRERPAGPEPIALNRHNERCIPTRNNLGRPLPPEEYDRLYGPPPQAAPPAEPMPPQIQPRIAPPAGPQYPQGPNGAMPDRADRSYHRVPLQPADTDPNDPPVLLVSPEDGSTVQRAPGSNDDRVIVAPPNANPRPSLRALLPDSQPGGSYVQPEQPPMDMPEAIPYCEADLPATGGNSAPILKMAVGTLGVGFALVFGAVYFRRKTPDHSWYSGGA